jgi:hypothetical protein
MDYRHISQAVEFYRKRGYVYVEDAPWHVGRDAYYATKPSGAVDVVLEAFRGDSPNELPFDRPYMTASGEQSFIQMMLDGQSIKRAVCVTPCFRWEPRVDMLHRRYFMKAELINANDVDAGHLMHMVHEACAFFEQFFPQVRVVDTGVGFDIVEKESRMELGSYGIRDMAVAGNRLRWIYGTGCAEPRLSTVAERYLSRRDRP